MRLSWIADSIQCGGMLSLTTVSVYWRKFSVRGPGPMIMSKISQQVWITLVCCACWLEFSDLEHVLLKHMDPRQCAIKITDGYCRSNGCRISVSNVWMGASRVSAFLKYWHMLHTKRNPVCSRYFTSLHQAT